MSPESEIALKILEDNKYFFCAPFMGQSAFAKWVKQEKVEEAMDEVNAKLGAILYTNNEPNELFIEYVAALVGRKHDGTQERCLWHGIKKPLESLLSNNKNLAIAIIAVKDNFALKKWRFSPPPTGEYPLANSAFFSPTKESSIDEPKSSSELKR